MRRWWPGFLLLSLMASGCQRAPAPPAGPAIAAPVAAPIVAAPVIAPVISAPAIAGSAAATASPEAALAQLDTRIPLPLLPHMAQHQKENMREHLVAVQEVALAVVRSDFAAIEDASSKLGLSPGMERMCQHMGQGAAGFTAQALAFHRSADEIGSAARSHSTNAVMKALGATLQLCTGCHATFRQQVVDEATWTRLTAGAAAPPQNRGAMPAQKTDECGPTRRGDVEPRVVNVGREAPETHGKPPYCLARVRAACLFGTASGGGLAVHLLLAKRACASKHRQSLNPLFCRSPCRSY